jgi:RNA polymerase sigma factor (sigma-70 family)
MTLAGQQLAAELYDPAVGSITKWLTDGTAGELARYGSVPQQVLDVARADRYLREDIALETFILTLPLFLRKLDAGAYDATRGTSITTFFIGACRNRMGDVLRAHHSPLTELRPDTDNLLALLHHPDKGLEAIEEVALARDLLQHAPTDLRAVLVLRVYEGISLSAAATKLGLNPATVRSHLLRFKKKLIRLHFDEEISIPNDTVLGDWIRNAATRRYADSL